MGSVRAMTKQNYIANAFEVETKSNQAKWSRNSTSYAYTTSNQLIYQRDFANENQQQLRSNLHSELEDDSNHHRELSIWGSQRRCWTCWRTMQGSFFWWSWMYGFEELGHFGEMGCCWWVWFLDCEKENQWRIKIERIFNKLGE